MTVVRAVLMVCLLACIVGGKSLPADNSVTQPAGTEVILNVAVTRQGTTNDYQFSVRRNGQQIHSFTTTIPDHALSLRDKLLNGWNWGGGYGTENYPSSYVFLMGLELLPDGRARWWWEERSEHFVFEEPVIRSITQPTTRPATQPSTRPREVAYGRHTGEDNWGHWQITGPDSLQIVISFPVGHRMLCP